MTFVNVLLSYHFENLNFKAFLISFKMLWVFRVIKEEQCRK